MDKNRVECYLRILRFGILNIRNFARHQDWKNCEIEADHIHNIPFHISTGVDEHYLNVAFPKYIAVAHQEAIKIFHDDWRILGLPVQK